MQATQYLDINQLLDTLLSGMRPILGEKLVGVYLYGSLAWGDFDHDISDIDILAATTADVDEREAAALKQMHEGIASANKQWDNRIEVQYFSLEGLRTFRSRASKMAAISPGEPFHVKEADKDWLMNWYLVRTYGVTLFGPPPETIIGPISKEEFVQSITEYAKKSSEWVANSRDSRPYQSYMILTMCRALYTSRSGEHISKKQAALWAEKELLEWAPLIQSAMRWRREAVEGVEADGALTFPETKRFVSYVAGLL